MFKVSLDFANKNFSLTLRTKIEKYKRELKIRIAH